MRSSEIEALLEKLNGSGSDEEWRAISKLRGLDNLPDVLLEKFQRSKRYGARASCVYNCIRYATTSDSAFQLGLAATNDRSRVVRYRAAMLLAVAQNEAAIPYLESMKLKHKESFADADSAILAILHGNPNLFVDRNNSGMVKLNIL